MSRLPGAEALGERPAPVLPRRTPMVAEYRPGTGMEEAPAQTMAHSAAEFESASREALQAKEQTDTLAAEDAFNKLRQKQMDLTYGKDGILAQKGAATINRDLPAEYGAQLSGTSDQLSKDLGNDNQRALFAKRAATAQLQLQEHAFAHVARESDVYANQVLEGTVDTESRVAAAGGDIPTSLLRVNAAIDRHAQRFGTPEQEVTSLKMKAADSVYSAKIKGLIYSDHPEQAEAMFNDPKVKAVIGPANKWVLEHEIRTAMLPRKADAIAEQAMAGQGLTNTSAAMDAGGEPVVQNVISTEVVPGGVPYRVRLKNGTLYEGTAPSEAEAVKRVRLAAGMPAKAVESSAQIPTTTRDLRAQIGDFTTRIEQLAGDDPMLRNAAIAKMREKVTTIAAAFDGIQRQAHGLLLTALAGGQDGKGRKPTTLDELLSIPGGRDAYVHLDPASLHGISAGLQQNQNEAMGRAFKSDPVAVRQARERIYLSDGDERKLTSPAQLTALYANNIAHSDIEGLRQELDQQMSVSGRTFTADVETARQSAHRRFMTSPIGSIQPDKSEEAAYKFNSDLNKKIAEYAKTPGKDARALITPGNPDYMLTPDRLATYMPNARAVVSDAAAAKLPKVKDDTDFAKIPDGAAFIDPDGKVRVKPKSEAKKKTEDLKARKARLGEDG